MTMIFTPNGIFKHNHLTAGKAYEVTKEGSANSMWWKVTGDNEKVYYVASRHWTKA